MNLKNKIAGLIALIISTLGLFPACNFWTSITDKDSNILEINSLSLAKTSLQTSVGSMEYVSVSVKPSNVDRKSIAWL